MWGWNPLPSTAYQTEWRNAHPDDIRLEISFGTVIYFLNFLGLLCLKWQTRHGRFCIAEARAARQAAVCAIAWPCWPSLNFGHSGATGPFGRGCRCTIYWDEPTLWGFQWCWSWCPCKTSLCLSLWKAFCPATFPSLESSSGLAVV